MKKFNQKKCFMFVILGFMTFCLFAANPEEDFECKLANDLESVIITGLKNQKDYYEIPETIEDFPIYKIEIKNYQETDFVTRIKFPEGVKELYFKGDEYSPELFEIESLPSSLENCRISGATLKCSINSLENLKSIRLYDVKFDEKKIVIKSQWFEEINTWDKYRLNAYISRTNIEELEFEEGILGITSSNFSNNYNLKKVTLPSTIEYIHYEAFSDCKNISEFIIPESVTHINGYFSMFEGTEFAKNLSLREEARIRKLFLSNP